ncbi:MAG: ribosome-associated translation inhibitor RaiA [Candidatus Moranbacteria bacterium]|jgi:ribosomal subunit interface protein|nr:ribosome-associated translation inhibitor RaiA [Candidatus Moranbacteria bacterium]
MNMKYLYKNIVINDKQREYIEKRLMPLGKLTEKILKTDVEIGMDKKGKIRVEVMISTPRDLFRAEETTESVEGSIDLVAEELKTQMTRKKEKIWTRIMRGARSVKKRMSIDKDARF